MQFLVIKLNTEKYNNYKLRVGDLVESLVLSSGFWLAKNIKFNRKKHDKIIVGKTFFYVCYYLYFNLNVYIFILDCFKIKKFLIGICDILLVDSVIIICS